MFLLTRLESTDILKVKKELVLVQTFVFVFRNMKSNTLLIERPKNKPKYTTIETFRK